MEDGSLDPKQTSMCRMSNRKLKMRDTFTKVFPRYTHGSPSSLCQTSSHFNFQYKDHNEDTKKATHFIDRGAHNKKDEMKDYHESMLKIVNLYEMKRKAWINSDNNNDLEGLITKCGRNDLLISQHDIHNIN